MDDDLRERLALAFRSSTRSPHHMALLVLPVVESLIREAKAEAWDEGHKKRQRRGADDCHCAAYSESECACGYYGSGALLSLADNPYRD